MFKTDRKMLRGTELASLTTVLLAAEPGAPVHAAEYVMKFSTPTINELQHAFMKR